MCFVLVLVVVLFLESGHPRVLRQFGIAPAWRVGDLKEILGSGFEIVRISQGESPRGFSDL
jgi:hypothetical protein